MRDVIVVGGGVVGATAAYLCAREGLRTLLLDRLDAGRATDAGAGSAGILEMRVGLRPLSADGRPVVGRVPGVAGAYLATGHGPSGLTLGPYSARLIADLILGRAPDLDLGPLGVERLGPAAGAPGGP